MKLVRMIISVTAEQKAKLVALRAKGYTESGYIRALLDRELGKDNPETSTREDDHDNSANT